MPTNAWRRPVTLLASIVAAGCASTGGGRCPAVLTALAAATPSHAEPAAVCAAPAEPYPFRFLVLQGGGVKGIAYSGAFEALDQQGILPHIEAVAGTSAGAIAAALLSLRYTPRQIEALLLSLDFAQLEDGGWGGPLRLLTRYGWYRGDDFLALMRCLVASQTGNPHATFGDLHAGSVHGTPFRDLRVYATDLTRGSAKEFSYEKTPQVEVALAVRESMSIPVFFASVSADRQIFVDGGVLDNYPITAFDQPNRIDHRTLGLVLDHTGAPTPDNRVHNLVDYSKYLLEAVLDAQSEDLDQDPADLERSVIINNLGISTTDFALSRQQKLALIDQGVLCTCAYLDHWRTWQTTGSFPAASLPARHHHVGAFGFGKCGSAFD
jgi:NTE family protein